MSQESICVRFPDCHVDLLGPISGKCAVARPRIPEKRVSPMLFAILDWPQEDAYSAQP
jgi:hypothetical protein